MSMSSILIPCSHNFSSNGIRVDVQIKYGVFRRGIFETEDGNHIVTPTYPYNGGSVTTIMINPNCPHCKVELTALFESMSYTEEQCIRVLEFLQAKLTGYLSCGFHHQNLQLNLGVNFIIEDFRPYDEASVREWVEEISFDEASTGTRTLYTPTSNEAIDALEKITATSSTTITCAICLEDLIVKQGEVGRRLPCKHEFHEDCILQWLHTSHYCPLCRFQLPASSSSLLCPSSFDNPMP